MKLVYDMVSWVGNILLMFFMLMGLVSTTNGVQMFGYGALVLVFFWASVYPILTD